MKIQILGSGCDNCKKLYANAESALKQIGIDAELEKVTDIRKIVDMGVMTTPALVIDGKVVSSGKVLTSEEIQSLLSPRECSCGCCSDEPQAPSGEAPCCCTGHRKAKKVLTIILLLFVFASLAVMIIRETQKKASAEPAADSVSASAQVPAPADILTVYYFHGNVRCFTCNKFEKLTKETVEKQFAEQLARKKIVLKIINAELPENAHFIKDFQLVSKSVVLQQGKQYKNLDRIWDVIRESDEAFVSYLAGEIRAMQAAK